MDPQDTPAVRRWIYYIALIYAYISFMEWFMHKYIMHGDAERLGKIPLIGFYLEETARDHKKHHQQILMNMDYVDPKLIDGFSWQITVIFVALMFPFLKLLTSGDNYVLLAVSVALCIGYCFLWNTIHNSMHNTIETMKISRGVPSVIIDDTPFKNNALYNTLYVHHAMHHLQKGDPKYNFNIILPLFDHLLLTKKYGPCFDNTQYCKREPDYRCKQTVKGCLQ